MSGVAVVGDALLDVAVAHASPIAEGGDVPASIAIGAGGQGANCAVRLGRLGVLVTLVTSIGREPTGAIVRGALRADGVAIVGPPAAATGCVVVLTNAAGERSMLSQRVPFLAALATTAWRPEPGGWLVVSGYPLLEPETAAARSRLATLDARRAVLGCAVPSERRDSWCAAVRELRPDLVILNRSEAAALLGDDSGEAGTLAVGIGAAFGCLAVVTSARVAAAAATQHDPVIVRRPSVAPVVDTTGAGDAFAARLILGLAEASWPPGRRLLAAALAAAMAHASAVARVVGAQGRVVGERPPLVDEDGTLEA